MIKFLLFVGLVVVLIVIVKRAWSRPSAMDRGEAAKLLGVASDADSDVVLEAHRRLIAKVHPDTGGSAELASRINQARDIMLK